MHEHEHQIPIWFFIGGLLALYGAIIAVYGLYSWINPPAREMALAYLHADVWWGLLMLGVGTTYLVRYWPWQKSEPSHHSE
jgi:hypothetical protein